MSKYTVKSLIKELESINLQFGDLDIILWDAENEEYRDVEDIVIHEDIGALDFRYD